MTREEASFILANIDRRVCDDELSEALDMAIKALEQEPILDKIRAEIKAKYGQCELCEYFEDYDYEENDISEYMPVDSIGGILEIIDKYKAESDGAKMSENPTSTNCTSCILDGTDACSRGAGRAVDGRVCEDFIGESEG